MNIFPDKQAASFEGLEKKSSDTERQFCRSQPTALRRGELSSKNRKEMAKVLKSILQFPAFVCCDSKGKSSFESSVLVIVEIVYVRLRTDIQNEQKSK